MHRPVSQYRQLLTSRQLELYGGWNPQVFGYFRCPSPDTGEEMRIFASCIPAQRWDHVSVTCRARCPTWIELDWVKRLFFEDREVAMQLHVPPASHVNNHPYTLHLWRPHDPVMIPIPPAEFV